MPDPQAELLERFNKGAALHRDGRFAEAVAEFDEALRLNARNASSHYNRARSLEALGRWPEAVSSYKSFLAFAGPEELKKFGAGVKARIEAIARLGGGAGGKPGATMTLGESSAGTLTMGGEQGTLTLGDGAASSAPASPALAWRPGDVVDGLYEVREVLGEGGFGTVHKVWHRGWRVELAVKAPRADKVASRRALESFVQEANAWVGLGLHPHIVTCFFVRVMGVPRIFIEFMAGGSLADWLGAGRAKEARVALDCAIQIARAMEYVHRRGLVHRDLKPGNCLMGADGTLKVTDFGLVHVGEQGEDGAAPQTPGAKIAKVKSATMTGRLGTPEYMAPEQWTSPREAGQSADVWAFGAMLHELLGRKKAFAMHDGEPADAFYARLLKSDWSFERPKSSLPELDALIARCLSVDPVKRPPNFTGLIVAMESAYAKLAGHAYPREAVKEPPVLADTLVNQGVSMADLGRADEALRLFGEALKLDPVHAGATYDQGLMLVKEGQGDGNLIPRLTALRRAQARDWVPAYLLGLAYHIKGQEGEARKSLQEAEKLGMARAFTEMRFADLYVALPKGTERTQRETERFREHMAKARELSAAGKAAEAYEELRKARGVGGYERSEEALALGRELGAKGTRIGLKGGWQKVFFPGSEGALALELTEGGTRLSSRHEDGTAREWDPSTGACLRRGRGGEATAGRSEARTADGSFLLAGKEDGTLEAVALGTGRTVMSTQGHRGRIQAVLLSADGSVAYTAGVDAIRRWELDWEFAFGEAAEVRPVAALRRGSAWERLKRRPGLQAGLAVGALALAGVGVVMMMAPEKTSHERLSEAGPPAVPVEPMRPLAPSSGEEEARGIAKGLLAEGEAPGAAAGLARIEAAKGLGAMLSAGRGGQALALARVIKEGDDAFGAGRYAEAAAAFEKASGLPGGEAARALLAEAKAAPEREKRAAEEARRRAAEARKAAAIDWVRIPGGSFMIGSDDGYGDEKPRHRVSVRGFELAKTEVTVAQYKACVEAGACTAPDTGQYCNWGVAGREDHPVNCVDWEQAGTFARWVGGRLPSEAEWEYAARSAGRDWKYPWGNEEASCARAVMNDGGDGCGKGSTWPVCSKPAGNTRQGLCDMAGNVWEWTQDWYHDSYNGAPNEAGAWESPAGSYRVLRGGSWGSVAGLVRAAFRGGGAPAYRDDNLGFRPAR